MTRRKTVRIANVDLSRRIKQKEAAWLNRKIGDNVMRFCLVFIMLWTGAIRFTTAEAESIAALVKASSSLEWLLDFMSPRVLSSVLGGFLITLALVIAAGIRFRMLSVVGSFLAAVTFAISVICLLVLPGTFETTDGWLPVLSENPGQYLMNDIALFGISISLLFTSWSRDD